MDGNDSFQSHKCDIAKLYKTSSLLDLLDHRYGDDIDTKSYIRDTK